MVTGAYEPRWVRLDAGGKPLHAIAFVVRRDHTQYAGHLLIEQQAKVIAQACGAFGSSADYLERTRVALVSHGVIDPYLERLAARVAANGAGTMAPVEAGEPPV
jgi:cation transport protein ChaC